MQAQCKSPFQLQGKLVDPLSYIHTTVVSLMNLRTRVINLRFRFKYGFNINIYNVFNIYNVENVYYIPCN